MIWFWLSLANAVGNVGLICINLRLGQRLRLWPQGFNAGMAIICFYVAGLWLQMLGPCVLPHPATIEFHQGMTLCPGQSATGVIKIIIGTSPSKGI